MFVFLNVCFPNIVNTLRNNLAKLRTHSSRKACDIEIFLMTLIIIFVNNIKAFNKVFHKNQLRSSLHKLHVLLQCCDLVAHADLKLLLIRVMYRLLSQ